jgi:hypothetical protein
MSVDLEKLAEKRQRWVEANRENGFEEGIKRLLTDLYPDNAHFIYELLQNAEDPRATVVRFTLTDNSIEFEHDGDRLFSFKDVESITSIGTSTKRDDPTSIGKFGVGFKAVFAYTNTPEIHSGEFHFRIHDLVIPETNGATKPVMGERETRFVFPFNHPVKQPRQAVEEIERALRALGDNTLLFLSHIRKIEYLLPDGSLGTLERIEQEAGRIEIQACHPDGRKTTSHWLRFQNEVEVTDDGKTKQCMVAIAYSLANAHDGSPENYSWKVMPLDHGQVSIYFPAEKEISNLKFHIHAPFASTVARDSVRADCVANKILIGAIAELTASSLKQLSDLGLLNVESFNVLPLRAQDFPEGSLFCPVYDKVREAFKTQPLLPADDGDFISASEAKLASVGELVGLFSKAQLSLLFDKDGLAWLHKDIATEKYQDLRLYLLELAAGMEIRPETLASRLTADFLVNQPMEWLTDFIQYAMQGAQSLRKSPFIRLASGGHVSLHSDKNALPSAWFSPKNCTGLDLSEFPLVSLWLTENELIRKFLEKEGVREIDAAAIVGKCILPLYNGMDTPFDEPNYRDHLRQIHKAYTEANDAAKKQLTTNLDAAAWLACLHASGNAQDKVVWKKPGASDVFSKTDDHEIWFHGLDSEDAYFLHPSVTDELNGSVSSLVKPTAVLTRNLHPNEYTVSLINEYSMHKQGLNGFNPNATVVGLQSALDSWSTDRVHILWSIVLSTPRIISGETQSSANHNRLATAQKRPEYTEVGSLCRSHAWLPNKTGDWCKPGEIFLTDLPDQFETTSIRASEVAKKEKLGMKSPEVEQALDLVTNGDDDLKKLIAAYQSGSNADREKLRKMIPQELSPPQPTPSFKDGLTNMTRQQRGTQSGDVENIPHSYPVSKPDHRQNNLNQAVANGVQEHATTPKTIRFSPVRDQPSNNEARQTLYQEYQGRCQVTGKTFPKASANANGDAENYFEVCSLLPYGNADYLNDAGNMLCVSADTMAKLNHASFEWLDDIEHKIAEFDNGGKAAQEIKIRIRLAGEECDITWSQRHFMRLVALYQKA